MLSRIRAIVGSVAVEPEHERVANVRAAGLRKRHFFRLSEAYSATYDTVEENTARVPKRGSLSRELDSSVLCSGAQQLVLGWVRPTDNLDDGAASLARAHGSFVAVTLSPGRVELMASRAPGPALYYRWCPRARSLRFSTELKALIDKGDRLKTRQLDYESALVADPARTPISSIRRVLPGTIVSWSLSGEPAEVAYAPLFPQNDELNELEEAVHLLRRSLADVIDAITARSAVCLISGGLDSSVVAALARRSEIELTLYSVGTVDRNEFEFADAFATTLGLPCRRTLVKLDSWLEALAEVVTLAEHWYSRYLEYLTPANAVHRTLDRTIVLSGYGSDVLFGGLANEFSDRDLQRHIEAEYLTTIWANETSQLLGGAYGLDVVSPFFDSEVATLSLRMSASLKQKEGTNKYVLRRASEGLIEPKFGRREKLGIHQSTGISDFMEAVTQSTGPVARMRLDALCFEVMNLTIVRGLPIANIDWDDVLQFVRALEL